MSGNRHHFIPRFLQKGFVSHVGNDEFYTWVFRKDSKPYNSNIINSGVEKKFYSMDNDNQLDDDITKAESGFADLVNSCRQTNQIDSTQFELAGRFFAHLEIRTRHIRQNFLNTTDYLLNRLLDYLDNPKIGELFLRQCMKRNPSIVGDALKAELKKQGIPDEYFHLLLPSVEQFVPTMVPNMAIGLQKAVPQIRSLIKTGLKDPAKRGQLKALNRGLWPDVKVDWYKNMNFHVRCFEGKMLPLGDSALLFNVQEERQFKPYLEKKDSLIAVILPISSQQILCCSVGDYEIDSEKLKKAIVECSLEYFIVDENNFEYLELSKSISQNAHILTESQVEKIILEMMKD